MWFGSRGSLLSSERQCDRPGNSSAQTMQTDAAKCRLRCFGRFGRCEVSNTERERGRERERERERVALEDILLIDHKECIRRSDADRSVQTESSMHPKRRSSARCEQTQCSLALSLSRSLSLSLSLSIAPSIAFSIAFSSLNSKWPL